MYIMYYMYSYIYTCKRRNHVPRSTGFPYEFKSSRGERKGNFTNRLDDSKMVEVFQARISQELSLYFCIQPTFFVIKDLLQ